MTDKKIIVPDAFKKRIEETIDISAPVSTVYGVQKWVERVNQGTSLYSNQAKQMFVLNTLREEYRERIRKWETGEDGNGGDIAYKPKDEEFKAISYQVY